MTRHGVVTAKLASKQHSIKDSSKSTNTSAEDATLKKVLKMHKEWSSYRKKLLGDWERDNKLYNNERVSETRYKGVSDTFVPLTRGTIETIVAALTTGDLSTEFVPQDIYEYLKERLMPGFSPTFTDDDGIEQQQTEEQFLVRAIQRATNGEVISDDSLGILNALYDYYWDAGDWDLRLEDLIKSGVKIGNGSWWLTWKNGRATLDTVAFPDFIFDPTAKSDETCRYMGRRYLASKKDLKKEKIADPGSKTGGTKNRYKGFNKLKKLDGRTSKDDRTDKEMKEQMLFGSTLDISGKDNANNDQIEVIEIWTHDRMYTIFNRSVLAEDAENPYKAQSELKGIEYDGILPGISWANYRDESLFIGSSETSTFWKEQERLNDVTNQKSDAVTQSLLRQKRADPALKNQAESMGVPGSVIWGQPNQYEELPSTVVPSAAFNEEGAVKQNIREVTATDQIVKGVGSSKDITATEANLQVANAGQRIEMKIRSLERGPLKRLAKMTTQYIRLFIADPFIVPAKASRGIKPLFFDPNKFGFDFEPKVTLTIDAKARRRAEQAVNLETYKILIADPTNDLTEVKKTMLPKVTDLDKDEIGRITAGDTNPGGSSLGAPASPAPAPLTSDTLGAAL